jgi:isopentenyldiphosphate isomerase
VSAGVAVRPLDGVPAVEVVAAPELGPADAARIEAERRRLDAHPDMFDGPILMVRAASPERLTVYTATYAWHTADRARPLPATAGALGVQLAVVGDGGAILWQRRTDTVDHPGGWTISVAGSAVPGVGLERQVVDEASEELGLCRADLDGLAPLALVESQRGRTVQVVFRARLRPGATPALRESEVAEVRLARDLPELGAVETLTASWWEELVRLATEDE